MAVSVVRKERQWWPCSPSSLTTSWHIFATDHDDTDIPRYVARCDLELPKSINVNGSQKEGVKLKLLHILTRTARACSACPAAWWYILRSPCPSVEAGDWPHRAARAWLGKTAHLHDYIHFVMQQVAEIVRRSTVRQCHMVKFGWCEASRHHIREIRYSLS